MARIVVVVVCVCASFAGAAEPDAARQAMFEQMRRLGNGSYVFGQVATWVHDENPDPEHASNWIQKVQQHTGKMPRYGCVTYDFHDNPFPDQAWNDGVKKMAQRGMWVGVFTFWANPSGRSWNEPAEIEQIFAEDDNTTKRNFYSQMDRMAKNLEWLQDQGIVVVYTPLVESDDRTKWHAKGGGDMAIRLYRLIHDYFQQQKQFKNLIWAYHTTSNHGALQEFYPGDAYVDVLGKSAYGTGLAFSEYAWAVEKKLAGKVIWWAELGLRGPREERQDCLKVLTKLQVDYPELAGFVFWSDAGHYNVIGNDHGAELMNRPEIISGPK
jgi:hypothetical protein